MLNKVLSGITSKSFNTIGCNTIYLRIPVAQVLQFFYLFFAASSFDIGFLTKTTLNRLLAEGDASSRDENCFYEGVKQVFSTAFEYAVTHMPVNDPVLVNAQFVQFSNRENCQVDMPQYFVHR